MIVVLRLEIVVPVKIVGKETHSCHVGEQCRSIVQVAPLALGQERGCRLQIALGKCAEDVHVEVHIVKIGVVLQACVGGGAQEVAEVREDKTRHYRVKVDDAKHVAVLVEKHIVHLCVAVADALGQFALTVQTLGKAHLVGECQIAVHDVTRPGKTPYLVGIDGIMQLLEAELHVVKVRNRLAQLLIDVGKH